MTDVSAPPAALGPGTLQFECNICSRPAALPVRALEREGGACPGCGAIVRFRAVVHHLSMHFFGESLPIARFPASAKSLKGIGMSDARQYGERLAQAMDYTNTFYHQEPRFDLTAPDVERFGGCDFVITSDVLEHVAPPVDAAFHNLRSIMKPGALLVLTVPFATEGDTLEHFPDLCDFRIEKHGCEHVLLNTTRDGRRQEFRDLIFHGGPGSTLEMRLFSEAGLRRDLERAGFREVSIHRAPCFEHGIYWPVPWSVPVTAYAG